MATKTQRKMAMTCLTPKPLLLLLPAESIASFNVLSVSLPRSSLVGGVGYAGAVVASAPGAGPDICVRGGLVADGKVDVVGVAVVRYSDARCA